MLLFACNVTRNILVLMSVHVAKKGCTYYTWPYHMHVTFCQNWATWIALRLIVQGTVIIYLPQTFLLWLRQTYSFDSKRDVGHCNWQRIGKCYCNSNQLINFYWRIQKLNNKKINGVFNCKKICTKLYGMVFIDLQKSRWMWIINLRKELHLYTTVNQVNFLSI